MKRDRDGLVPMNLMLFAMLIVAMASSPASHAQTRPLQASEPPVDPLACGEGIVMLAVQALGYKGDQDFWKGGQTACRLRPENPKQAILALTYTRGDQLSGVASADDAAGYDLDVVIVRTDDGSIVARNRQGGHIDSDAVRFEGIAIDTANYALAPGQRAFGIRVEHAAHCYHCNYGQTDLTLFLQHGKRLDAILDTMTHDSRGEWGTSDCDNLPTGRTRTIKIASSRSHGLADLLLTTTKTEADTDDAAAACQAKPETTAASTDTIKVSFNGRSYLLPTGIDPP